MRGVIYDRLAHAQSADLVIRAAAWIKSIEREDL